MDAGFHILEHPSDLGIEATGADLIEAFRQAAFGLISIVVDPTTIGSAVQREIALEGSDVENLLVQWLSEILYLYDGEHYLVSGIEILELSSTRLKARVTGEFIQEQKHRLRIDVKAVTYHQLSVRQEPNGSTVRVFLDI
jgi:SHS2 domain-containing protein